MEWKYFTDEELQCSHCGENKMNDQYMQKISSLRTLLGFPFIVTSAYRCPEHPSETRKEAPGGHSMGLAMDIHVYGEEAYRLLQEALKAGFTGIGVSQRVSVPRRFIHLDILTSAEGRPRPWLWGY